MNEYYTARRNLNSRNIKTRKRALKIIKQHKRANNCFNLTILYV
ncbi:putative metal homeostasis protein [Staphylococcus aureus]